jgi:uncharacterized protein (DUF4415 family)
MPGIQKGKAVLVKGVPYERREDGTLVPTAGKTDWAALDAMSDAEISAAAEADPDAGPMTDEEWAKMKLQRPGKGSITIRIDQDLLDYYRAKPGRYQSNINQALRQEMERERESS